ncbi:uncharacterized protein LOC110855835 isoform X1 [Folsomia candida]|uniref:uncharacterized protein LOC110855835 isoform X1 n=1 Tax=Folsomia candida TaxID=158441 RepID=UPI001604E635|nr:uncharacterized protein LOC110855835 isoform X1 [Folsomia candida]
MSNNNANAAAPPQVPSWSLGLSDEEEDENNHDDGGLNVNGIIGTDTGDSDRDEDPIIQNILQDCQKEVEYGPDLLSIPAVRKNTFFHFYIKLGEFKLQSPVLQLSSTGEWAASISPELQPESASTSISTSVEPISTAISRDRSMVCYQAGILSNYINEWRKITKDNSILEAIVGYKLPFKEIPFQLTEPSGTKLSETEVRLVDETIRKLMLTEAISEVCDEPGQFISSIFTVAKPDGSRRPIINLKKLNDYLDCPHFKMENIKTASQLVSQGSYMCVVDLKEAYHAIPIAADHRKFLKFRWRGKLYKYNCIPYGLCTAALLYTKLLKPVISLFRATGILCVYYLDDLLIIGSSYSDCMKHLNFISNFLETLGFTINKGKSQLIPSQRVKYLGFLIDSIIMRLILPSDKVARIITKCKEVLATNQIKIQTVAELAGWLISACPATRYGFLYTRSLEIDKTRSLLHSKGNYSSKMSIIHETRLDLEWWISNIGSEWQYLQKPVPIFKITSDASLSGWGAHCGELRAKGRWATEHIDLHINVLELWGAFYALKSFVNKTNVHVLIRVDSSTAMAYINRQGGCKSTQCFSVAKLIWQWCENRGIIITATWINTKENYTADKLSRAEKDASDFMLGTNYFTKLTKKFGCPNMDLFASYQTKQCNEFYSWKPDPFSIGVDAFTYEWEDGFYAFPPFNMIGRVINKIIQDKCEGIVVAPMWPTQAWFPLYQKIAKSNIIELGPNKNLLFDPYSRKPHQINSKLKLMAAVLSGRP